MTIASIKIYWHTDITLHLSVASDCFCTITARVSRCDTDWLAKLTILSGPLEENFPTTDLEVYQDTEGKGKEGETGTKVESPAKAETHSNDIS